MVMSPFFFFLQNICSSAIFANINSLSWCSILSECLLYREQCFLFTIYREQNLIDPDKHGQVTIHFFFFSTSYDRAVFIQQGNDVRDFVEWTFTEHSHTVNRSWTFCSWTKLVQNFVHDRIQNHAWKFFQTTIYSECRY